MQDHNEQSERGQALTALQKQFLDSLAYADALQLFSDLTHHLATEEMPGVFRLDRAAANRQEPWYLAVYDYIRDTRGTQVA